MVTVAGWNVFIPIAFEIYFRVTVREYDGLLGKYKSTDK